MEAAEVLGLPKSVAAIYAVISPRPARSALPMWKPGFS